MKIAGILVLTLLVAMGGVVLWRALGSADSASPLDAGSSGSPIAVSDPAAMRTAIYDRTSERFDAAIFFKPRPGPHVHREFSMAPLIIQQVDASRPDAAQGEKFGALRASSDGLLSVDTSNPTIYSSESKAMLNGALFDQLSYLWFYPGSGAEVGEERLAAQGVRLTLDSQGLPVIMEVLSQDAGMTAIYVNESLEARALEAHGPPLPGRRFSIESAVADYPNLVVANVIADGPMPMGPFVYQRSGSRAVTALICRCMPSQFDRSILDAEYELLPLETLRELGAEPLNQYPFLAAGGRAVQANHSEASEPDWLARCLRLPPDW